MGVLMASVIAKLQNGRVPVRVLNTRDETVRLVNFTPTTRDIAEFNICSSQTNEKSASKAKKVTDSIDLKHLEGPERVEIYRICSKYFDNFYIDDEKLGVTNLYKEAIKIEQGAQPVYTASYRLPVPQSQRKVIDDEVNKMIKNGIIEE